MSDREILRDVYAKKSLSQIPRMLGNMDRNQFSPTYGCFHRDFWLDKTIDFPDAVRQFGIHALALVYKFKFPGNIYYNNKKVLEWIKAGLNYWSSIQHKDGSFDEFYPNERGWVGPTAFTTFTSIESLDLIKNEVSKEFFNKIKKTIIISANFIAKGESEEDHLANHHAMACLAVWKAYKLTKDDKLFRGYKKLWKGFLSYHNSDEGWSKEYDGIDPGYLSATISFLGKIYQDNKNNEIFEVCKKSIETCSYFVYPNGFYAGSLGSRNTLHFYTHGFEIFSKEISAASSIKNKMLIALSQDKLVPPEIMSDRYLFYRVPELLQSFLDYTQINNHEPKLPYELDNINIYLNKAKIWVNSNKRNYIIANLAKGGVIKVFDKQNTKLIYNDCGLIGKLANQKQITTQWIDPKNSIKIYEKGFKISGKFNFFPTNKYFNTYKFIIFRIILILIGWNPSWAHWLKGTIRKILMLGTRQAPIDFEIDLKVTKEKIVIQKKIKKSNNKLKLVKLSSGGEFFVRYVPQSRYFQNQELNIVEYDFKPEELNDINNNETLIKKFEV